MQYVTGFGLFLMMIQVYFFHKLPLTINGIIWGHITFPISIFLILIGYVIVFSIREKKT